MLLSSVVDAASLLSHLPIWYSPLSLSPVFHFLLPSFLLDFCSAVFHLALKHLSYLFSTLSSHLLRFLFAKLPCPLWHTPPVFLPANLVSLSVRQDKLSEEVQKQHNGPEERVSPLLSQAKSGDSLPANANDANQAEEDKDKTKPLLERLKALEVTTPTQLFFFSSLSLLLWFSLCFPSFYLEYLLSCLFILFHIHSLQPPLAILCGLACLPVVRVLAQLHLKAWQLIKFFSVLRLESKVILWEMPQGPQAVLQFRFVFLCALGFDLHSAVSPRAAAEAGAQPRWCRCLILPKPLDTHPLTSLQQLGDGDLIKLGLQSYRLSLMLLHVTSWCCCGLHLGSCSTGQRQACNIAAFLKKKPKAHKTSVIINKSVFVQSWFQSFRSLPQSRSIQK